MAQIKTRPTEVAVDAFIETVPNATRRADAKAVVAMMERLTGEKPVMWGPTIIGFGSYRYRYDSGHAGEMCRIGFSPRKAELVLYVLYPYGEQAPELAMLGKHRTGKSCLYINKLADVDLAVLERLMQRTIDRMNADYPA